MRVGLFDSGIGGLAVLEEIIIKHPNNEYIYLGDTLNMPYGTKTKEQLLGYASSIIDFLEKQNVDMIIVPCGTISSLAPLLKSKVPLLPILEPTINYINNSDIKDVILLATPATINTGYFASKLNVNVITIACPSFVPLLETSAVIDDTVFDEYLKDIKNKDIWIILGCTHYALIQEKLEKYLNNKKIIDMGEIISNNIKLSDTKHSIRLFFTKDSLELKENIKKIIGNVEYEIVKL